MAIPSGDERFFNRLQRAIERTVKFELNEYQISKESWSIITDDMSKMTSSFTMRPYKLYGTTVRSNLKWNLNTSIYQRKVQKVHPPLYPSPCFLTSDSSTLIGAYQLRNTYTFHYVIFFDPSESVNFKPSYHSAFLLFQFNFFVLNR